MTDRLYRHPTDRAIAGVAGGLAAWLNLDPSLVRVAWVLLAIFSGGIFVIVYIVMMIVVPLPPPGWVPRPRGSGPPPGGVPGWQPGGPGAATGSDPGMGWGPYPGPGSAAPSDIPPNWPGWTAPGPDEPAPGGAWGLEDSAPSPASATGTGWTAPQQPAQSSSGRGNAGLVVGVILVGLGVWFLVDQYVRIDWEVLWPVAIMLLGGALIAGALLRNRAA